MKNLQKIIFLIIAILAGQVLMAQTVELTVSDKIKLPPGSDVWSPTKRPRIIQTIQNTLDEYAQAATLFDSGKRQVTGESIERFQTLFSPAAGIVEDYMEYPPARVVPFKDYSTKVYSLMRLEGIQLRIEGVTIKEVVDDPAGFYVIIADVDKSLFNYITSEGQLKSSTGKFYTQEFWFDIPKSNMDKARITAIKGDVLIQPDDDVRYISLSGSFKQSLPNITTSDFWNQNHSDNTIDVSGNFSTSIGFELLTSKVINSKKAQKKNLALSIGARYSNYKITTALTDFSISPFEEIAEKDGNQQPYLRMVNALNGEENLNFNVIEVPVGLSYRVMKKLKSAFYIHGRFIPAFVLSASGDFSGSGTYDGFMQYWADPANQTGRMDTEFRFLRDKAIDPAELTDDDGFGPYDVGNQNINVEANPSLSSLVFAVQLSPTFYLDFNDNNPTFGLMIGLDITKYFGSFLEHSPTNSDMLKFNNDYESSLIQHYTNDASNTTIGLRVGLYHKLVTKP